MTARDAAAAAGLAQGPAAATGGGGSQGVVVWFTGLPSSGKSTLAERVSELLRARGHAVCVLDGDQVRGALSPAPGYDDQARAAFYGTLGNLAALLARQGLVVLVPATAYRRALRAAARAVAPRFVEVFVDVSAEECARRDAKGLYAAARAGRVSQVPGAGAEYEAPLSPDVVALGGQDERAAAQVLELLGRIFEATAEPATHAVERTAPTHTRPPSAPRETEPGGSRGPRSARGETSE